MRTARGAFTLAEVVIAMTVTAVVGLAVATVGSTLSNVYQSSEEHYQNLQTARVATTRLQASLRKTRLVTATDADGFVLWREDLNGDGEINPTEVSRIYFDAAHHKLFEKTVVFPAWLPPLLEKILDYDVPLTNVSDSDAVTGSFYPSFEETRMLADNVQAFQVTCDRPGPLTRLTNFRIRVGEGEQAVTMYGSARLRADKTEYVGTAGSDFVLVDTVVGLLNPFE